MKNIVVLGAGFGGVAAGLQLQKHLRELDSYLVVVDQNPYHTFTPSLYEVATSEQPKKNIAIPLKEIFGADVTLLHDSVSTIDPSAKTILLKSGQQIHYDYLIIALGSESAYFNIPGLKEYSIPLKSVSDALKIKNLIRTSCCKEGECQRKVRLVIGGGGFSGTELAAEMLTYKDRLSRQHHLAPDCLEISVIQGSDKLLKELDPHVSDIAMQRVSGPNVTLCFGGHISEVTDKEIKTDNGKAYPYDIFIWTGGVSANSLAGSSSLPVNKHGQLMVNEYLQVNGHENIFAVGDIAGYVDPQTQKSAPGVAQVAEDQGKVAGENVYRVIKRKPLIQYHLRHWGYVVPLRGHFAAAELMGNWHMDGFLGYLLQQLIFLRYLWGILPWNKALVRWNKVETTLMKK